MSYHLIIQPLDSQYSFLDEIGKESMDIFEPKIRGFEVLPMKTLPKSMLLKPRSLLGKLLMRGRKMIHLNDLSEELKRDLPHDPRQIRLAILPHLIIEFGYDLTGLYLKSNLSVISTYGMKEKYLRQATVGLSLHEIGHNLGLKHCKTQNCIMKTPAKPKNFYKGNYQLCNKHKESLKARRV